MTAEVSATTPDSVTVAAYSDLVWESRPIGRWSLDENPEPLTLGVGSGELRGGITLGEPAAVGSGTSVRFDGESGHLWVGEASSAAAESLAATDAITVEAWVKPDSVPVDGRPRHIARWRWYGWGIYLLDGRIHAEVWEQPADPTVPTEPVGSTITGPSLEVDVWYHVVMTKNSDAIALHVDGIEVGRSAPYGPIHYVAVDPADDRFGSGGGVAFGRDADVDGNYFSGWLDEIAIYPKALSAEQIGRHARFADG